MATNNKISRFFWFVISFLLHIQISGYGAAQSDSPAVVISPASVKTGDKFRVLLVVSDTLNNINLDVSGISGPLPARNFKRGGAYPGWWSAEFTAGPAGEYKVQYRVNEAAQAVVKFSIVQTRKKRAPTDLIWQTEKAWDQAAEDLYSAWIQMMFPPEQAGRYWEHLHNLTRDPERNFLFDHLGLGEDRPYSAGGLRLVPDCADNPFFLRAYFAWKLGLPYGNHKCDRGREDRAPLCREWFSNHSRRRPGAGDVKAFQYFIIAVMDSIHSGSARTSLKTEVSDLYPVLLSRESLRPGTVFADPYGHTLTLVGWIPQQGNDPGRLMAVDAQPDGTIGLKRFWQGSFFFTTADIIGGPGFKRFRPIIWDGVRLKPLNNQEITTAKDYGDFSLQQEGMQPQIFYDRMERIISPEPLPPEKIFRDLHEAVQEQLNARVLAVKRGEEYMRATGYKKIPMPSGAAIFQTTGPWEDFSTPSRDLRLLISLDVLLDFPDRMLRTPESFVIPAEKDAQGVKLELLDLHTKWSREFGVSFIGSDGISQKLTLAEIIRRQDALEIAYNPNDCIEIRWGTPIASEELHSCQRQAPREQREKMEQYRKWFRTRTYPRR